MLTSLQVDVWSVGCILAELLGGRPFFKGRDYVDQLNQILHILGTPSEETLARIGSPRAQEYVRNLPTMKKQNFRERFPRPAVKPEGKKEGEKDEFDYAVELLDQLLAFDPMQRISVEDALQHKYLEVWHDATDEPVCPATFDFAFEVVEDIPEMKRMILSEVTRFRQIVRMPQVHSYGSHVGQVQNVPIPDNKDQWRQEDPRPQEAYIGYQSMGLEQELQGGLDAMRH